MNKKIAKPEPVTLQSIAQHTTYQAPEDFDIEKEIRRVNRWTRNKNTIVRSRKSESIQRDIADVSRWVQANNVDTDKLSEFADTYSMLTFKYNVLLESPNKQLAVNREISILERQYARWVRDNYKFGPDIKIVANALKSVDANFLMKIVWRD